MMNGGSEKEIDPFLQGYNPSDLQTASEFLSNWLPFLSKGLCNHCSLLISDRVRSLTTPPPPPPPREEYDTEEIKDINDNQDTNSLGSWKDGANGVKEQILENYGPEHVEKRSPSPRARPRMSWADMAQEEMEMEETDEEEEAGSQFGNIRLQAAGEVKPPQQQQLPREKRERIRFNNVIRKKDYICFERVNGKLVNILDGLELHTRVFSVAEQKRIVDFVYQLQEKGKKKELKARTFTAPQKWMRGKGRVTIQFGCCYNYATDKNGNPPGILHNELVDPIPHLFKVIIKRLVTWHVLPPTCVPDSCIVNIYDEGDCIPPHIDNHDFLRPFCTVSFLSECDILFGTNLKIEGPGEFSGAYKIPLPVGSVLVLNGNGADVAKHCVPAVPTKRISITFRKMDESKWPAGFVPEPDLQGLEPLPPNDESVKPKPVHPPYRQAVRRDETRDNSRRLVLGSQPRFYGQSQTRQQGSSSGNLRRTRLEY